MKKMIAKGLKIFGAVFLGLSLWLALPAFSTPSATAKSSTRLSDPTLATPNPHLKPLKVWNAVSSWYGEEFDGKQTATGETYDMYGVTAASPSLPLGSVVRVVNRHNHRSAIVRINDRGPYVDGRDLDVSYEVARRLGFEHRGLANVRLELLEVPQREAQPHE
jgi:Lytic transglycolase